LKVLFVSSGTSKNGISSIVNNQGFSLAKAGLQVDFFKIKNKGLKSYIKHIFKLRNLLKLSSYDIIHAHYGLCGIVGLFAKQDEKLITSFMGNDVIGSKNTKGVNTKISVIFSKVNSLLSKYIYDYSIAKSAEMAKCLSTNKLKVIPNGVNFETCYPIDREEAQRKVGFDEKKTNIIFVSNPIRPEKNFLLAQEAIDYLQNKEIILHTIFDFPIEKLVDYYNASDLLLMTSFHEGSPNVIKEGMACNCPIVCTRVGDVTWLFGNEPGHFLTSFKAKEIAANIMKAIEYRKKYNFTKGRNRLKDLGLESRDVAKKIIEIYNKVLS
jgi:teichuronic acid biosynthesis glycosyltransferase TuaC